MNKPMKKVTVANQIRASREIYAKMAGDLASCDAGTVARVLSVADDTVEFFGLEVPVIPDLDERMAEVAVRGRLDMSAWHCGTTHCRAGWAVMFGGEAGRKLEDAFGPGMAGQLIYEASTGRPAPNFFAGDEEAMADIMACAQAAKKK